MKPAPSKCAGPLVSHPLEAPLEQISLKLDLILEQLELGNRRIGLLARAILAERYRPDSSPREK